MSPTCPARPPARPSRRAQRLLRSFGLLGFSIVACARVSGGHRAEQATARTQTATRDTASPRITSLDDLAFDTTGFDRTVRPQDDFFRFVNGRWIASFEIPTHRDRYDPLTAVIDRSLRDRLSLIEETAKRPAPVGTPQRLLGDLYRSFMDSARIERVGISALAEDLATIDSIRTRDDLVRYMGASQSIDFYSRPFAVYVRADREDPSRRVAYVEPGRLLRDREVFLQERHKAIRDVYAAHVEQMYALAGWPRGPEVARIVLDIETRLARGMWSPERARDRIATYNRYSIAKADSLTPHFEWRSFFAGAQLRTDEFVLTQPSYFSTFDSVFVETPVAAWKDYFRFQVVSWRAEYLPQAFAQADQDKGHLLSGQKGRSPPFVRNAGVARNVSGMLPNALEQMYVERFYDARTGARAAEVVENLRASFGEALDDVDWMTPATKAEARRKLERLRARIGHGTDTVDYSGLGLQPDDLIGNVRRIERWGFRRSAAELLRPVDRSRFPGSAAWPATSYFESNNEFVLTAAALQPPLFDPAFDLATTYGVLGSAISHEMGHAFDNRGRRFDADGVLRDWWTPDDEVRFAERAAKLAAQYDAFVSIDGTHVNGKLTVNENIADLLGVTMAYRAYRRALNGRRDPVVGGLTGDQRFFVGFARWWGRGKARDEALRTQLAALPHAPYEFRVNGVLMNVPEFYRAFGVKDGDRMHRAPADRVRIW